MSQKPVTLMDLANRVGVSKVTVSRALNGSGRMSDKVRDEIRRVAVEMDYRPKLAAKFLRSDHTNQLELIITEPQAIMAQSGFFGPILAAFVNVCEADWRGYHIEICPREGAAFVPPQNVAGGLVDGVIVAGKASAELQAWLNENSLVPWVSLDEEAEYCVTQAYGRGVFQAVQYLVEAGHREILFVGGDDEFLVSQQAVEGFKKAVKTFGLAGGNAEPLIHRISLEMDLHAADFVDWARNILSVRPHSTAVYCNDLRLAHAFSFAAAMERIRIPEELSIIGLGPENYAVAGIPKVTSLHPNFKAAVARASAMIKQRIQGAAVVSPQCQVDMDFVMRGSTGAYATSIH